MTFCCPPSTALHQTTPNSSLEILPCALLLPPTSTLDAVEASKRRFPSVARPQRRPPVSPSLLAFSTFPDRRPAHHPRRPSLFSPKPSRVTIGSFDPPPFDLSLSIVPRITLYSLDQLSVSLAPALLDPAVRHPAAGFRPVRSLLVGLLPAYITSRLVADAARSSSTSTQQASDELHDNFLTAHAHPAPGTLNSRFWPMTPLSETQDVVLL